MPVTIWETVCSEFHPRETDAEMIEIIILALYASVLRNFKEAGKSIDLLEQITKILLIK